MNDNTIPLTTVKERTKHIYWKAVTVGTISAVGITFLFNFLTIAVGLILFKRGQEEMLALTFGTVAWMVVGSYMTLYVAGWIGGRQLHGEYSFNVANGLLHGFVIWSLYLIVSIVLLSLMPDAVVSTILTLLFIHLPAATEAGQHVSTSTVNNAGYAALVTFFIFFMGMVGCCIGAACGIKESKKYYIQ
ncbi:hypothetical protein [Candidatus Berkiella aquae]|uniref:Uncharacterized protein n=1 Tax=Candidatus Berkiella aquae TaxID=295108 RepID=A0A0Q9YJK8_9GAMM|nr:hypothetical protein [Candidatus Berkiella aquae]MCS5711288.1 hypothetical protein [Candidatus Berkiella aquae]